jgi:acetate kinase
MKILVLNAGSSSYKASLFDFSSSVVAQKSIWDGKVEVDNHNPENHADEAVKTLLASAGSLIKKEEIVVVGHRVVHGGEKFTKPTVITPDVKKTISNLSRLAPLHNPANLRGIEIMENLFPNALQVAVFDTAFHHSLPPEVFNYAIPTSWRQLGVRRYGFHGISHEYCAHRANAILGIPISNLKIISCHLGNGSSLAAIKNGQSIDTTMGFTPLEGLIMATRCGSIDPGIIPYIQREKNISPDRIDRIFNDESGLEAISGYSDMRDILRLKDSEPKIHLAYDMFIHSTVRNIGAMIASLGGLDVLILTAGIGENSPQVREDICEKLSFTGLKLDKNKNNNQEADSEISEKNSKVRTLLIHTREDFTIALACFKLGKSNDRSR